MHLHFMNSYYDLKDVEAYIVNMNCKKTRISYKILQLVIYLPHMSYFRRAAEYNDELKFNYYTLYITVWWLFNFPSLAKPYNI